MEIKLVLTISVLLQFIAAFLAIRLIRVTGSRIAWILIASAISFMAFRRGISLFQIISEGLTQPLDLPAELIALATSALLVVGIALIEPVFLSMKRSEQALQESEQSMNSMSLELALSISEVFEALKKISSGDPAVRIPETSEIELIAKLKQMVNMTSKNIGEFVDQSHEFAICLAEHFDVLNRVSKGDLNVRVSGSSQIELLESLKNVTNEMIITVSDEMAERKETEKKLLYASEEWRKTFDSMPYGVMLVGRELIIIKTNDYISRLTGIPIKEMIGKKCYQIIHGIDRPIETCPLIKASETLSTETIELYEPGVNKYFMTSVTPMLDEKGHIKSYVHSLVDITEAKDKEKELIKSRNAFFNMLNDLDVSYAELKGLYNALIHSFANAIDAKSPWTKGHSERVTNFAIAIAKEMGLQEKDIEKLRIAALLHDVGKIGTLDVILDKPGRLNADEFDLVKMHPAKDEEILRPIKQLQDILPIIRHHHERIDGNGYPDRLKGEEIPLYARILHIADSFDSMTADRPYRSAPGIEYSISELKKYSGTQFDPKVVEIFLNILDNVQEV